MLDSTYGFPNRLDTVRLPERIQPAIDMTIPEKTNKQKKAQPLKIKESSLLEYEMIQEHGLYAFSFFFVLFGCFVVSTGD